MANPRAGLAIFIVIVIAIIIGFVMWWAGGYTMMASVGAAAFLGAILLAISFAIVMKLDLEAWTVHRGLGNAFAFRNDMIALSVFFWIFVIISFIILGIYVFTDKRIDGNLPIAATQSF